MADAIVYLLLLNLFQLGLAAFLFAAWRWAAYDAECWSKTAADQSRRLKQLSKQGSL